MKPRLITALPLLVLSLGFLLALALPHLVLLFPFLRDPRLAENRALREFPSWPRTAEALDKFPSQFEAAYNDRFGLRSWLVQGHARAIYHGLGTSPSPKVVLGRDGWLYFADSLREHQGFSDLPEKTIERWLREFSIKQKYLAARGIKYLIVIPPNKEAIYPNYLPSRFQPVRKNLYVKQLLARVPPDSGLEILDLRKSLWEAKPLGNLYYKTDTHWNTLGAFCAASAVVERLQKWFPQLHPFTPPSESLQLEEPFSGDLAKMAGLEDLVKEKISMVPNLHTEAEKARMIFPSEKLRSLLAETPAAREPSSPQTALKIFVTGDSFSIFLSYYLAPYFQRTVAVRPLTPYPAGFQRLIPEILDAEKPDIYIEEILDRMLPLAPENHLPQLTTN